MERPFEALDKMNQEDIEKNTRLVAISVGFLGGRKVPQGAIVEMGIEASNLLEIMNDEVMPILVLVNKKEYFKRTNPK